MAICGKGLRISFTFVAVVVFAVSLVSCPRMAYKRYITFDVRPVEVPTGHGSDYMDEYQPCQEIRGAESGKILKRVASPGDTIQVEAGVNYDFRLIVDKYGPWAVDNVSSEYLIEAQRKWQEKKDAYEEYKNYLDFLDKYGPTQPYGKPIPRAAEDPGAFDFDSVAYTKVVKIGPKTFRIIDPYLDDKLVVTLTNYYECVFKLDKEVPGVTDRVERIAFCLNEGETLTEYTYPLEMTFTSSGELTYFQPANQIMTVRLYMKPGSEYTVNTVLKKRGSEADEEVQRPKSNVPEEDGYYQYSFSPELDSDKTYSLDKREIIISTGLLHPEGE